MTFQSAISAGNLTKLRSASYSSDYLMKLCTNRVVLAGQLNGSVAGDWASFTYDSVSAGVYTDVVVGQALLISATNNITSAQFRGRVRLAPTSSIIYANENSTTFADNSYFWIIDTHDAQYRLSRPDANGVEQIDYNESYHGLRPAVAGLQTVYANYDPTGGKFRIAFSVSAFAKQSGNTVSSYQFTFKAGTYTVISGSLSSSAVTVDFNPGEQWGQLVVTDSGGVTATRYFLIEACDNTINPPDTGFDAPPIACDLQRGWSLSLGAFAGVDSVLNNTFAVVFRSNEQFGGVSGGLFTNNIAFCGWLQRETDPAASDPIHGVIQTASFDFNSVSMALARLNSQLVPFFNNTAPTQAEQVLNLTPWRAIGKFLDDYTTLGTLCDLAFDDHSDTYLFPTITTQGGNALSVLQGIAQMLSSVIEFAPDGRIQMVKDATYQSSSERSGDVVIAAWQAQDFTSLIRAQEQPPNYGIVDTDGAYYNTTNGQTIGFTARAPGIARGEGEGNDNWPSQIAIAGTNDLTALNELIQRATNRFNFVNNNEYLDAEFPDGYNFLIPSRQQLYTITASALTANGVNRISYDTSVSWLLESCSIARGDNGTTFVRGRFHRLQDIGTGGINTTLVSPGSIDFAYPDLGSPSFDFQLPEITMSDAGGTAAPIDANANPVIANKLGQLLVAKNSTNSWDERNFINLTTPQATMTTPSDLGSYQIKQILLDPFSSDSAIGCYILASDGTNSAVWYTANVAAGTPTWTKGASFAGVYSVIRATQTSGTVMVYATNGGGTTEITYDFTVSNQGFSAISGLGTYVAGVGWQTTYVVASPDDYRGIYLNKALSATVIRMQAFFDRTAGTFNEGGGQVDDALYPDAGPAPDPNSFYQVTSVSGPNGSGQSVSGSGSFAATTIGLQLFSGHNPAHAGDPGGQVTLTKLVVDTTGGGTNAQVRLSSNNGASFGAPIDTAANPGTVGGFDVQRAGANSFAAAGGKVYRATTLGGTYSAYYTITGGVEARCIIVPYFNWGGTRQTTSTNPDILVGLSGADGSSRTLLWIEGGATPGTVHDLTPVANYVFDNPNAITVAYNHHIACFGKVSSTYTLRTTTDKGVTWFNRGTLTSPGFIRCRRGDSTSSVSGTNRGQLYLAHNNGIYYSSKWGGAGMFIRNQPASGIDGFDIWSN